MGELGKTAFIREEMTRLGYWPPPEDTSQDYAETEARLKPLYTEKALTARELKEIEKEISEGGDVPRLLTEIRRKRIERVRTERTEKAKIRASERQKKKEANALWREKSLPHLGVGVSGGLSGEESDEEKLQSRNLPILRFADDVSSAMEIPTEKLAWLCYDRSADSTGHYARFTIPKKKGGLRALASPKRTLRVAQSWILREVLEKLTPHSAATAFSPGCSVQTNAAPHVGKGVVVKTDLRDFFPTITWRRVKGFYQNLGYSGSVSTPARAAQHRFTTRRRDF